MNIPDFIFTYMFGLIAMALLMIAAWLVVDHQRRTKKK